MRGRCPATSRHRPRQLPQLQGQIFLSEAGLETELIFLHKLELPHMALFPLMETESGRTLFTDYFQSVVDIARRAGTGVVLETATWRASAEWGPALGYTDAGLARVNRRAVRFLQDLRDANLDVPVVISGNLGPCGDGYVTGEMMSADEAAAAHLEQIRTLAAAGADLISALTLTYSAEAIGIVVAATSVDIPAVISFTVETDGRLPSGQPLAEAIREVDAATDRAAAYFMGNCAHPTHLEGVLSAPGPWGRLRALRANASPKSHDELEASTELDRGDEGELTEGYQRIRALLPCLAVVGGCCGTDLAHLQAISDVVHA